MECLHKITKPEENAGEEEIEMEQGLDCVDTVTLAARLERVREIDEAIKALTKERTQADPYRHCNCYGSMKRGEECAGWERDPSVKSRRGKIYCIKLKDGVVE